MVRKRIIILKKYLQWGFSGPTTSYITVYTTKYSSLNRIYFRFSILSPSRPTDHTRVPAHYNCTHNNPSAQLSYYHYQHNYNNTSVSGCVPGTAVFSRQHLIMRTLTLTPGNGCPTDSATSPTTNMDF